MWNVRGGAAASETLDGVKPESTDTLRDIKCNLCTIRVKSKIIIAICWDGNRCQLLCVLNVMNCPHHFMRE